ncbi:MAG: PEGA domain-containing protein [Vicinamibacterales bacterium]
MAIAVAGAIAIAAPDAAAQPRGGRRGGGPSTRVVVAPPIYYYGYGVYDPFWGAMWSPYGGWYGPWGPWDRPLPYDPNQSSARVQVKPKNAEVYVDGYLAGTVDDFDGALQRLNVQAGEHTITLYLEGYETRIEKVVFRPRATINIKYELKKLQPGESSGPRPEPTADAVNAARRPLPPEPPDTQAPPPRGARTRGDYGTLSLRIQPGDATVIVDGQEWDADASGPLTIELPEGTHDVEVRQDGFAPFHRTVRVRAGNVTTLNVSLSR